MSNVKTLKDLLYRADKLFNDEIYLREYKKKKFIDVSFSQFRKSCDSVAVWIQAHFDSKVHCAVIGTTSAEYLTAWFGVQCSCNVSVPIDTTNNIDKIADEIKRSDSEVVFLDDKHVADIPKFKEVCPAVKYFIHINKKYDDMLFLGDIIEEYKDQTPTGDIDEEDLAAILFTSGTTGVSKGVMLT
ncbi:MAG: acyl--CoA ligase, partial [Clostridia bacterium]|nr:acyl--CoA ligase [Clostridia bacterium]